MVIRNAGTVAGRWASSISALGIIRLRQPDNSLNKGAAARDGYGDTIAHPRGAVSSKRGRQPSAEATGRGHPAPCIRVQGRRGTLAICPSGTARPGQVSIRRSPKLPTISIAGLNAGEPADLLVDVLDAAGNLLCSSNPLRVAADAPLQSYLCDRRTPPAPAVRACCGGGSPLGHENPFPRPELSASYVIRQETFAGTHGIGRDAPDSSRSRSNRKGSAHNGRSSRLMWSTRVLAPFWSLYASAAVSP